MPHILNVESIPQDTCLRYLQKTSHAVVEPDDSALLVMTDFKKETVLTVNSVETIDRVSERMMTYHVRLLFVIEDEKLVGLVTSTDILGKKPVLHIAEHGEKRSDISAKDLMTPTNMLEAVFFSELKSSTVGDVIETMKKVNRQHMLVLDYKDDEPVIRGLLSTTKIGKQMGVLVSTDSRANSFSELGSKISRD